jgi:DNA-binding XRE family transcriptional regulator
MNDHHTTPHPANAPTQTAAQPRPTRRKKPQSQPRRRAILDNEQLRQLTVPGLVDPVARPIQHDLEELTTRLGQLIELLVRQTQPEPATADQLPANKVEALLSTPVNFRLRHARTQAKLTQQALAQTIGVHRLQVVRWETGRNRPSRRYRQLIAKATGVPLHFLQHNGPGGTP